MLTGIGFTMAMFVAELAFASTQIGSAKIGILGASIVAAGSGLGALVWLTSGARRRLEPTKKT
ncbi:Na+/H+ antiporter NhaA type [Azospirillum doebereinerae]